METETATDLEQLRDLLRRWGVGFSMRLDHHEGLVSLMLTAKEHEYVDGYYHFEAAFNFGQDGSFKGIDIYE